MLQPDSTAHLQTPALLNSRCQDDRVGGAKSEFHGLEPRPQPALGQIVFESAHQLHDDMADMADMAVATPIYPPYPNGVETLEAFEATWLRHCSANHLIYIAELVHASGICSESKEVNR